jgi:hypothetical protein
MLGWTCEKEHNLLQYTITALCVGKHPDLSTWRGSCFPEGWQIWMLPYTEGRNCFIIFLPMFYRLSPLWGKIWVVRRGTIGLFPGSANLCQCFIGYLPCGGKLGCSAGNNRCCSAGNNRVVSRQRKFWQNISIILLSHD